MEFFALLSIISLIVALFARRDAKNLQRRLEELEKVSLKLNHAEPESARLFVSARKNSNSEAPIKGLRHELVHKKDFSQEATDREEGAFVKWLKKNPLMNLGLAFVFIAFLWFVRFAYVNEWIGANTVIFSSLLLSVFVLLFGFYDALHSNIKRGLSVLGLGVSMVLATSFAARFLYDIFDPIFAFAVMFVAIVFAGFASFKFDSKKLAGYSYFLAVLMPFLTLSDSGSFWVLFSYLLLINFSYTAILAFKKWDFLGLFAFVASAIYSLVAFLDFELTLAKVVFAFVLPFMAFGVLFWRTALQGVSSKAYGTHILVGLSNTFYVLAWIFYGLEESLQSPFLILWAFLLLFAAFSSYMIFARVRPFYLFSASSLVFLSFVLIKELDYNMLLPAFAALFAIATFASYFISKDQELVSKALALLAIPSLWSFTYFASWIENRYAFDTFSAPTVAVLAFLFILTAVLSFVYKAFESLIDDIKMELKVFGLFVGFWVLALIWFVLHDLLHSYGLATLLSLLVYSATGLAFYLAGNRYGRFWQKLGAVLLVAVAARILVVDVWELELAFRIATFAAVGLILIATAYNTSKNKDGKIKKAYEQEKDIE